MHRCSAFKPGGAPLRPEQLKIDIVAKNAVVRPLDALPGLKDVDLRREDHGSTASDHVRQGHDRSCVGTQADRRRRHVRDRRHVAASRRCRRRGCGSKGRSMRSAEMLSLESLRDSSGLPLDAATTKGNVVAQYFAGGPDAPCRHPRRGRLRGRGGDHRFRRGEILPQSEGGERHAAHLRNAGSDDGEGRRAHRRRALDA